MKMEKPDIIGQRETLIKDRFYDLLDRKKQASIEQEIMLLKMKQAESDRTKEFEKVLLRINSI